MQLIVNQPFQSNGKIYIQGQKITDAAEVKFILDNGSEYFVTKIADAPVDAVDIAQVAKKADK